jgi:hypothetical protein
MKMKRDQEEVKCSTTLAAEFTGAVLSLEDPVVSTA